MGGRVLVACVHFLRFSSTMEEWRAQLEASIAHGLHNSNEEQEDMVVEWLLCASDGLEEEEEENKRRHGRSRMGRHFDYQNQEVDVKRLFHDYFAVNLVFNDATF